MATSAVSPLPASPGIFDQGGRAEPRSCRRDRRRVERGLEVLPVLPRLVVGLRHLLQREVGAVPSAPVSPARRGWTSARWKRHFLIERRETRWGDGEELELN